MPLPDPPDIRSADGRICLVLFYAVPETDRFVFMPTRALWSKEAVNSVLPGVPTGAKRNGKIETVKPATWLNQFRRVEQMTWAPGYGEIIEDRLVLEGGWADHPGAHALNLFLPSRIVLGDAAKAGPWIKHLELLYPDEANDITDWFAHRVQKPGEKINHALVMGGYQGIGKDWLLQALKLAVGPWNFQEISPIDLMGTYTPFVKAVVLRMSEAHDLGESGRADRYKLYERVKSYAAAPPDTLPCVDKYIRRFYVPNVIGLAITTNHKTDGVHLSNDDRRHLVAWSYRTKEEFSASFWNEKWHWLLDEGGAGHVAAYLAQRDLSNFNPGGTPKETAAFFEIVNASAAPEDAELADALDELKRPDIVTLLDLTKTSCGAVLDWMLDRKHRRSLPYRLERCGYVACRNLDAQDGLWKIHGRRQALYARTDLAPADQLGAARAYVARQTLRVV
jgi:hypothetical protein